MNRYLLTTITLFSLALMAASSVFADKKPAGPSAQAQSDFTARWYEAMDGGNRSYAEFASDVTNKGTDEERRMMANLEDGKAADGGEAKGFRGDPNDPGPTDWSDWNVETDANGNVTGFKEKDFEAKDADGDGEISDDERGEWNKKKQKEHEEAGGPPGDNYHPPDWDKNEDGKPDPGFTLDCWKCRKDQKKECMDGASGPCMEGSCAEGEQCLEHPETIDGVTLTCHACSPTDKAVDSCEALGHMSDPACGGACTSGPCVPVVVDKDSGQIVPSMQTRTKGSTVTCYRCMTVTQVSMEWVVIVIETPAMRLVLDKKGVPVPSFTPTSIMALANKDQLAQKLQSMSSMAMGGFDPQALLQNAMGLDKASSLLQETLAKGGKFTDDCFNAFKSSGFMPQMPQLLPSVPGVGGASGMASMGGAGLNVPGMDVLKELTSLGPVVACGMSGADKVLTVFDSNGRPVDALSREDAKSGLDRIRQALDKAQQMSSQIVSVGSNPTGALWQSVSGMMSSSDDKYPNDPYFSKAPIKKKRKKVKVHFGGGGFSTSDNLRDLEEYNAKSKQSPIDQWGLTEVGYLMKSDPDSAWNVIDGQQKNVVVAVIDSGMDMSHPDGPEHIWTNEGEIPDNGVDDDGNGFIDDVHGWNFVDDNNSLKDGRGHGTFVAGIIAARTNNGRDIAGINPGAVILPVKAADDKGETNSLAIFRAVHYAVDNGAAVINISLGNRVVSQLEELAFNYARSRNVFIAAASGNLNEDIMRHGPASASSAFAVGAIDKIGTRSTVSNWGANNGILAPGEKIYSLLSREKVDGVVESIKKAGIYDMSGTSFSAPIVAATASLMRAKDPSLTAGQIEDILQITADDIYEPGWDSDSGAGLLDAASALRYEWSGQEVTAKITGLRRNFDSRKRLESVDVFATVRGDVKEYVVELAKGKYGRKFRAVSQVYASPTVNGLVAHIDGKDFNGDDVWTIRVSATNSAGQTVVAQALFFVE